MIARELGGKSYALFLSALAAAIAPMYLLNGGLFTTNFREPLFWMGCAFAILAIKRNDPRHWVWFGVVAELGLNNKYLITVFGWEAHRPCALRSTADLVEQVAVAGRAGGFPDLSAQPHLERAAPLAFRRTNAQHSGRRPGRTAISVAVLLSADAFYRNCQRSYLNDRGSCIAGL